MVIGYLQICVLGLALGTDSFSVALSVGLNPLSIGQILKISFLFAISQGVLLLLGMHLALTLGSVLPFFFAGNLKQLSQLLHLVGFLVLLYLGFCLFRAFFHPKSDTLCYLGKKGLLLLTLSVSVDALVAGLALGFSGPAESLRMGFLVALVIFLMVLFALFLASRIYFLLGRTSYLLGGLLLWYVAVVFLLNQKG